MTSPELRADEYWAAVFQVDRSALRRPGLHVSYVDDRTAGIYVLQLGETVRVRAPRHRRAVVDGLDLENALDAHAWRAALRGSDAVVLGPAAHYLAGESVGPSQQSRRPSLAALMRMCEGIAADEVEESGVLEPDVDLFGLRVGDALVAVSSLQTWVGGRTDVGVLVAPGYRGRGLGRKVAAMALNDATARTGIARWRCREDNRASVALAESFGLQQYGRNLGIRLGGGG